MSLSVALLKKSAFEYWLKWAIDMLQHLFILLLGSDPLHGKMLKKGLLIGLYAL